MDICNLKNGIGRRQIRLPIRRMQFQVCRMSLIAKGDENMAADIIVMTLVIGYCAYIVYKIIRGKVTGKGNPFSCSGDCQSCMGACRTPEQQEKLYREIKRSIEEKRRMNGAA